MAVKSEKIYLTTKGYGDIANITGQIKEVVVRNSLHDGLVCVSSLSTLTSVVKLYANSKLQGFLPQLLQSNFYRIEGLNLDEALKAEINSLLLQKSLIIPVLSGNLQLDLNEQVFLVDLTSSSGKRTVLIQVID